VRPAIRIAVDELATPRHQQLSAGVEQRRRGLDSRVKKQERSMAREVELKLEVPPDAAQRVADLPWLRELASGPARQEQLVSVYFDTAKQKLHAHGLSLRVRHQGDKRLQTIKLENKGAAGGFGRDEWEKEIARDRPDLTLAEGTALEKLATRKLKQKLRPIFETVIERTAIPLRSHGTTMELALDRGLIRGSGRRQPVSEVEIEVKKGDPSALADVAERLARSLPVTYGSQSKAERGYALCHGETGQPVRAAAISLDPSATTAEAFATIGLSCLKQAMANRAAVIAGKAEGIHQMRVGLRRLRAAISLFKHLARDVKTETVKRELKWLTDQLGPAREYEVLIAERVEPSRQTATDLREMRTLHKELKARRERSLAKVRKAVESDRFRALGLHTALWLANGAWSRSDDPLARAGRERPVADFAADTLSRRTRQIVKKADRVAKLSPRRRHKLRIAVKKLRYGSDFFAGLFDTKRQRSRRKAFGKILTSLQDSLGTLNDIEMHRRLAKTVVHPRRPIAKKAEKSFAMGVITGIERKQVKKCLTKAGEAGRELAAAMPFWR
jgi:triphosphatase